MQECLKISFMRKFIFSSIIVLFLPTILLGQDLLSMLDSIQPETTKKQYVLGTFKSVRLINGVY